MRIWRFSKMVLACVLVTACSASAVEPNAAVKATTGLKVSQSWDGTTLKYPQGDVEITGMQIEIAPGGSTGWHLHTVPSFGVVLSGTLEVQLKDGRVKRLQAGDMLAEVVNTLHNGRAVGDAPVKLVVFYAGVKGQILTHKEEVSQAVMQTTGSGAH